MKVLVLIAGVEDPRWPITPDSALAGTGEHRVMSPFDEAALEMALRLRDADPATLISVRVAGGAGSLKIARAVAALRIDDLATVVIERSWDQAAAARALAPLCEGADLVLIGREFGDFDDGLVPAMLAGLLGWPFFSRAQTVEGTRAVRLLREGSSHVESLTLTGSLVASVTNDRRTRLRKPLMKNVMHARQVDVGKVVTTPPLGAGLSLDSVRPSPDDRAEADCTLIEGPAHVQARALADILWDART